MVILCRITVFNFKSQRGFSVEYKVYTCTVCGYEYNEELGDEDHGLAAGTRWADVPDDWECPECGVGKSDFEMVAV